jgi:dTDP-4-dehydrorhamnose reductase
MSFEKKIIIIGSNGQLGSDLVIAFKDYNTIGLLHSQLDIIDLELLRKSMKELKPDFIINTAAYHRTDYCELYPDKAFGVNSLGALNLAKVSEENNCTLIHISTDYVFNGEKRKPYIEADSVSPLNIYACSKVAGEFNIMNNSTKHYIIRTSGLYGESICRAKGENFVTKMLRMAREKKEIKVVNDEVLTPTWTRSLSSQIFQLIKKNIPFGIIHATDEGSCSWYEFAKKVFYYSGVNVNLKEASVYDFAMTVKRPTYSVLSNKILTDNNINLMNDWQESLKKYINIIC